MTGDVKKTAKKTMPTRMRVSRMRVLLMFLAIYIRYIRAEFVILPHSHYGDIYQKGNLQNNIFHLSIDQGWENLLMSQSLPCDSVAQLVEHLTFNQRVVGSSPTGITIFSMG